MFLLIIFINLFVNILCFNLQDYKKPINDAELDAVYWESLAKQELFEAYHKDDIYQKAKNVIIFVGGGMGVSTITPARILKGQLMNTTGEEARLVFEAFPNTCLLKTYSIDSQVTDSAAAATALLYGVKTNNGVTGVTAKVKKGVTNCETVTNSIIHSIYDYAHEAEKRTGIVTNTRITEATAAGTYASSGDINWEGSIPPKFAVHTDHEDCRDIARQLIEEHPGKNLNVILGGGGRYLYPKNYTDPISGKPGQREDGRNLVEKWLQLKKESGLSQNKYKFVKNKDELLQAAENKQMDFILGIFGENHLNYDKERDPQRDPSLENMVESAIKVLKDKEQGFLLVVESGLIDLAHHNNYANLALYETLALEKAVERALHLVSIEDTLIIVTGDHSQALTMNGHQPRGHNIMGVAGNDDESLKGYTTLMYSNGPGYKKNRTDPNTVDTSALRYQSHSAVYLDSSHHTGEDVALYSIGPMSQLFHGTKEQTFVAFAVHFAACIGVYANHDHCTKIVANISPIRGRNSTQSIPKTTSIYLLLIFNLLTFIIKFI